MLSAENAWKIGCHEESDYMLPRSAFALPWGGTAEVLWAVVCLIVLEEKLKTHKKTTEREEMTEPDEIQVR